MAGIGRTPYTYQILFRRHILPVIERISGLKSSKQAPIGWHTLRRSLATLLISNGENVKVRQSQLRHTTPNFKTELRRVTDRSLSRCLGVPSCNVLHWRNRFRIMVSAAGFEPATHALKGHCSTT